MAVKVKTRPSPEICGGLGPNALVLLDSFGVGARAPFFHFYQASNYEAKNSLAAAAVAAPVLSIALARAWAARQLRRDVRQLFSAAGSSPAATYHEIQLDGLPAPVQRYFRHVLPEGQPYLRGLRLRHGGQFKADLKKDWIAIEGQQYITADPPGFIWQGTTRQFVARDEFVAGHGRLDVRLLGAVPIAGGTGPAYDQGELLRWLVESSWLPTALLPSESIAWTALDDHSARLTLTHRAQSVSCLVRFNERNEIAEAEALRHMDEATERPWQCRYAQYQRRHGVLIPTVGEAGWVLDGQYQPYARFTVVALDYDQLQPF